jgi:hypothetical protein
MIFKLFDRDVHSMAKTYRQAAEETSNIESEKSDGEKRPRKRGTKKYDEYVRSQSSTSESDQGKFIH